jgi:hypothetical protein
LIAAALALRQATRVGQRAAPFSHPAGRNSLRRFIDSAKPARPLRRPSPSSRGFGRALLEENGGARLPAASGGRKPKERDLRLSQNRIVWVFAPARHANSPTRMARRREAYRTVQAQQATPGADCLIHGPPSSISGNGGRRGAKSTRLHRSAILISGTPAENGLQASAAARPLACFTHLFKTPAK